MREAMYAVVIYGPDDEKYYGPATEEEAAKWLASVSANARIAVVRVPSQ